MSHDKQELSIMDILLAGIAEIFKGFKSFAPKMNGEYFLNCATVRSPPPPEPAWLTGAAKNTSLPDHKTGTYKHGSMLTAQPERFIQEKTADEK